MVEKQKRHPEESAGHALGFFPSGLEGEAENHHHQQREKQHGVEDVARTPFQANVFAQVRHHEMGDGRQRRIRGRRH